MKPKDQDPKEMRSGVIYSFQCNHIPCNEEYIGETGRTLGERCKEHLNHHPHPCAHMTNRIHHHRRQFQYHRQGRPEAGQDHQGIYLHKGKQSNIKPKHW